MKEEILRLRELGYSYRKIQQELGCSKGTICYHLGVNQTEKHRQYSRNYNISDRGRLSAKFDQFFNNDTKRELGVKRRRPAYNRKEVIDNFMASPICYLTGVKIDLQDGSSYNLDHIIPRAAGGTDEPENMGLCTRNANMSKSDMSVEEYFQLCEKVLRYNKPELFKD